MSLHALSERPVAETADYHREKRDRMPFLCALFVPRRKEVQWLM